MWVARGKPCCYTLVQKSRFKLLSQKKIPSQFIAYSPESKETTLFRSLDLGGFIPIRDSGTVELEFVVSDNSRGQSKVTHLICFTFNTRLL